MRGVNKAWLTGNIYLVQIPSKVGWKVVCLVHGPEAVGERGRLVLRSTRLQKLQAIL